MTLNAPVCVDQPCVCVLMVVYIICVIKNAKIGSPGVQETQKIIIIYFLRHCLAGLLHCDMM